MRTAVFSLLLLAGISQPAAAQTQAWANKMFDGDLVHDFGVVPHGAQLKYSFKMTNKWTVPIEITDAHPECGCTQIRECPRILQPNETSHMAINMDGTRFSGQKQVKINVSIVGRDPKNGQQFISTATVTVQANARGDVSFSPSDIDFGLVQHGQSPARFFDVQYLGGDPSWNVTEIYKTQTDPFDLDVKPLPTGGRGYRITAKLKANAAPGAFKKDILLKTTDPTNPSMSFTIQGRIQASLSVNRELVTLDATKVNEMVKQKIVVTGSKPFRIVGIDGQGDGLTAVPLLPDNSAQSQLLEIRFQPAQLGELKKQLTIRTDLNDEKVTVTIHGSGT